MRRQLAVSVSILLFLFLATIAVVLYGRGYRFGVDGGRPDIAGTGLLVATSTPNGAEVYINDHLTTATDNTINLAPGEYTVQIKKAGYFPWVKKLKIQKEVVAKADALLLPTAPKLDNLTTTGVQNPVLDPSRTKLAYTVASQSARKNGIYVLDMTTRPVLTLQSSATQVTDDTSDAFSTSLMAWSPDGQELVATIAGTLRSQTTYLLRASSFNQNPQDVTATLDNVAATWEIDRKTREKTLLENATPQVRKLIAENFSVIAWSPDETKILFEASQSATLPFAINPRLIGTDSTPQDRNVKKGLIYVYDIKEDKNYKIDIDSSSRDALHERQGNLPLIWYSDSRHLLYVHEKKIDMMEYDGSNQTTIYAGPFLDNYIFPWTNASKIVILTNLGNPDIPPNLYSVILR